VLHLRLIILSVGGDVSINSEAFLVTDFVNLKIKPTQSFRRAHRNRVYVRVLVSDRICMSIYVYSVFLKKTMVEIERSLSESGTKATGQS
jgi:hypothetical protein